MSEIRTTPPRTYSTEYKLANLRTAIHVLDRFMQPCDKRVVDAYELLKIVEEELTEELQ